jgi:hypothetical protein
MAKVKKCLDAGCTQYILTDDNKIICQPKDKCDIEHVPDNFQEQFVEMIAGTSDTVYLSKQLFKKVKVGEELTF